MEEVVACPDRCSAQQVSYSRDASSLYNIDHHWYVVLCKARKEAYVAAALQERLGLVVYSPEVVRRSQGKLLHSPLFPCYIFVWADLQTIQVSSINAMHNVVRLVAFDGIPQQVPVAAIETILQQVAILNGQGGVPMHRFQPGETFWLQAGPLQGLQAIFVGPMKPSERVRVLVEFLGALREVELDVHMVASNSSSETRQRDRRTRGHGRRITKP